MTLDEFEKAVFGIMEEVSTMTLATCAGEVPWATDVYFSPDGFDLVFFSSPSSRHCRNLAINPACAVTIHPVASSWQDIRGLQMEGLCQSVDTVSGKGRAYPAYFKKFPFARALLLHPEETVSTLAKAAAHLFQPFHILYLDNSLGFGTRYSVRLKDGALLGAPERVGGG
jgi:uncharacterized protein